MTELLLFSSDFEAAKAELEAAGASITHRLGDRIFVARLPEGLDVRSSDLVSAEVPADVDEAERIVIEAWRSRGLKENAREAEAAEGLAWDAEGREPPG